MSLVNEPVRADCHLFLCQCFHLTIGANDLCMHTLAICMGTRGAYGFRINEEDRVNYVQFDSYPSGLGKEVMSYVVQTPVAQMKKIATRIVLVHPDSTPSRELIQRYRKYADLGVSEQSYEDWYCLLRKTQGTLFPYNNDLRHMIDYHDFLFDSLFCEWAYIINLDTEQFEVYKGFNKDASAKGRYAGRSQEDNYGYMGVTLIKQIPLADITKEKVAAFVNELETLISYPVA